MITVTSYPNRQIDAVFNETDSLNSFDLIKYIWVDLEEAPTDTYVEIIYNGVITTLFIVDECRYTPIDIAFMNKSGALQFLTFFKAVTEAMSITSEEFESDRGQPIDGSHQFVKYNIQGRSEFTANSGFVDESMNETFRQLLLSEKAWLYDGSFIPLNVKKKSIEFKTRQKDRLINYEMEFLYAYNEINSI